MKIFPFFFITLIALLCINWRTPEPTLEGNFKQIVNFYGKLITYQDKEYKIDNISINGKYKQIPMYDRPRKHPKMTLNSKTNKKEIILAVNPKNNFITSKIDLNEVGEIRVPHPNVTWIYQKEERQRRLEYIEITVISKNKRKTKSSYLLPRKTKIRCNEINSGGPVEKIVPIASVKRLIIEGYSLRDNMDKNNKKNKESK